MNERHVLHVHPLLRHLDYGFGAVADSFSDDAPGADRHDGAQLTKDQPGNAGVSFEKASDFSAAHYYNRSRSRTSTRAGM
jgi:hypothetical protein